LSTTAEILTREFDQLRLDLIAKYKELGMKASGDWEREAESVVESKGTVTTGKVKGLPYTNQLVSGRKPGEFPPVKQIEKWLYDKGIKPIEDEMKLSSLAFLIARKIAQEGTKYFKQGGTDLVESVVTPERIQSILDKVKGVNAETFTQVIVREFKEAV